MKNKKISFDEAMNIGLQLKYTFISAFKKHNFGISQKEMRALAILKIIYEGEVSIKKLKEDILDNYPEMSKVNLEVNLSKDINSLVQNELIEKTKDKNDNRIMKIKLTKKGKLTINKFHKYTSKLWEENYND